MSDKAQHANAPDNGELMDEMRERARQLAERQEDNPRWLGIEFGFNTERHGYTISIQRDQNNKGES